MPLVETVLIGLAAWRVSALVSYERGPFDVFLRFRKRLGFAHDHNDEVVGYPDTFLGKFIGCTWCLTPYAAVAFWAIWEYVSEPIVIIVAAATVAVVVERWCHSGKS